MKNKYINVINPKNLLIKAYEFELNGYIRKKTGEIYFNYPMYVDDNNICGLVNVNPNSKIVIPNSENVNKSNNLRSCDILDSRYCNVTNQEQEHILDKCYLSDHEKFELIHDIIGDDAYQNNSKYDTDGKCNEDEPYDVNTVKIILDNINDAIEKMKQCINPDPDSDSYIDIKNNFFIYNKKINKKTKVILIGDIRGGYHTFYRLLLRFIKYGYIEKNEHGLCVANEHVIILCGNVLDHGNYSVNILDLICDLIINSNKPDDIRFIFNQGIVEFEYDKNDYNSYDYDYDDNEDNNEENDIDDNYTTMINEFICKFHQNIKQKGKGHTQNKQKENTGKTSNPQNTHKQQNKQSSNKKKGNTNEISNPQNKQPHSKQKENTDNAHNPQHKQLQKITTIKKTDYHFEQEFHVNLTSKDELNKYIIMTLTNFYNCCPVATILHYCSQTILVCHGGIPLDTDESCGSNAFIKLDMKNEFAIVNENTGYQLMLNEFSMTSECIHGLERIYEEADEIVDTLPISKIGTKVLNEFMDHHQIDMIITGYTESTANTVLFTANKENKFIKYKKHVTSPDFVSVSDEIASNETDINVILHNEKKPLKKSDNSINGPIAVFDLNRFKNQNIYKKVISISSTTGPRHELTYDSFLLIEHDDHKNYK